MVVDADVLDASSLMFMAASVCRESNDLSHSDDVDSATAYLPQSRQTLPRLSPLLISNTGSIRTHRSSSLMDQMNPYNVNGLDHKSHLEASHLLNLNTKIQCSPIIGTVSSSIVDSAISNLKFKLKAKPQSNQNPTRRKSTSPIEKRSILTSSKTSLTCSESDEELKRQAHIISEQKRRQVINDGFSELKIIVPSCNKSSDSKAVILKKAITYIYDLLLELNRTRSLLQESGKRVGSSSHDDRIAFHMIHPRCVNMEERPSSSSKEDNIPLDCLVKSSMATSFQEGVNVPLSPELSMESSLGSPFGEKSHTQYREKSLHSALSCSVYSSHEQI